MKLQPPSEHPHGLRDQDFDALFTTDKPIIFAFHGYPWLIHRLTYRRHDHDNLHVRGYKEEGTTTTPFDMCVLNDLDRFHLVGDVIDRVPQARRARRLRQAGDPRQADRAQAVHRPLRRRHARDRGLELGPGGRPGSGAAARARPRRTTSDRGDRHERLRDPARRDRMEPERPAHRHDRHPVDRQRAPLAERLRPVLAKENFGLPPDNDNQTRSVPF